MISTNTGGLPEVNIQGETGFLSDVGDVEDMAKNAIYILESDERLQKFKDSAYESAKRFSIDRILPKYELMYQQVISDFKADLINP